MIGYVTIGSNNLQESKAFYLNLLSDLGVDVIMDMERIIMLGNDPSNCMLSICKPYDGKEAVAGNGNMVAIPVQSRETVDKLYAKALEAGATDEGEPGERMPTFYAAYIRDLDRNKVAFYYMG